MFAKVATKLEGIGDGEVGKVLVPKGHYLAFSNISGQLVLSSVTEGAELNPPDLGANGWCEMVYTDALWEKLRVGCVGIFSVVIVFEWFDRRIFLLWIPSGEVMGILLYR